MLPLQNSAAARFRAFAEEMHYLAPTVAHALNDASEVVRNALLGVQTGRLSERAAVDRVLSNLNLTLPGPGHRDHEYRDEVQSQVHALFGGMQQSVRSHRVQLLVTQAFVAQMSAGYSGILQSRSSSPRALALRGAPLIKELRRLCEAAAALTPPSTTIALGEGARLSDVLVTIPDLFFGAKTGAETGAEPGAETDAGAVADEAAPFKLLAQLREELKAAVEKTSEVVPEPTPAERKTAAFLQARFASPFSGLEDLSQDQGAAETAQQTCSYVLERLVKTAGERLAGGPERPGTHPLVRFLEQEQRWFREDGPLAGATPLTERCTRVRMVLNTFDAQAFKND